MELVRRVPQPVAGLLLATPMAEMVDPGVAAGDCDPPVIWSNCMAWTETGSKIALHPAANDGNIAL